MADIKNEQRKNIWCWNEKEKIKESKKKKKAIKLMLELIKTMMA